LPVIPVNGFAIYNMGEREDFGNPPLFRHDGVALKLEAGPAPVGPGKVSTQALYSTGGNNPGGGFRTVAQSARDNFGAEGYWSYLMLVSDQAEGIADQFLAKLAKSAGPVRPAVHFVRFRRARRARGFQTSTKSKTQMTETTEGNPV
jgi:hypothetical protein